MRFERSLLLPTKHRLVNSYVVNFCGTKNLRDASREQVEGFVIHLADWAEKDRNALLYQLNSCPRTRKRKKARHETLILSLSGRPMFAIHSVPDGIFLVRVDRARYR